MDGAMNTPGFFSPRLLIDISYFLTACLFILGLKRMSSPVTARSGIVWAGAGMVVATLVSFLYPGMSNYELIIAAIVVLPIIPLGTMLGAYGLWFFCSAQGRKYEQV